MCILIIGSQLDLKWKMKWKKLLKDVKFHQIFVVRHNVCAIRTVNYIYIILVYVVRLLISKMFMKVFSVCLEAVCIKAMHIRCFRFKIAKSIITIYSDVGSKNKVDRRRTKTYQKSWQRKLKRIVVKLWLCIKKNPSRSDGLCYYFIFRAEPIYIFIGTLPL